MSTQQPLSGHTVRDMIQALSERLRDSDVYYGHGTADPVDEAAALVYAVAGLSHADGAAVYEVELSEDAADTMLALLERRISERIPLPYLLGEAWFAGQRFFVDERVLIPRSPIAGLILDRFAPWVDASEVHRVLEIGTGSGCIALAAALELPWADVVATDISAGALEVAEINRQALGLEDRVALLRSDLFEAVDGKFDLIITNPPYVPVSEKKEIPDEYRHEPDLALYSGSDGLDSSRRILQDAARYLTDGGALILEVGAQWPELEQAFPGLPLNWLELAMGGEGVALIYADELRATIGDG